MAKKKPVDETPVDPRHEDVAAPGPMDNDEQMLKDVRKTLPRGMCKSLLVADWEGQRGVVKCVAKGKGHEVHEAATGDKWYIRTEEGESKGHWGMDFVALSNVNTMGAGPRPIDA